MQEPVLPLLRELDNGEPTEFSRCPPPVDDARLIRADLALLPAPPGSLSRMALIRACVWWAWVVTVRVDALDVLAPQLQRRYRILDCIQH